MSNARESRDFPDDLYFAASPFRSLESPYSYAKTTIAYYFRIFLFVVCFLLVLMITVTSLKRNQNVLRAGIDESPLSTLQEEFHQFMTLYNKVYESEEERLYRFKVFVENRKLIHAHNSRGNETYTMGVNAFTDLTREEFKSYYTGYIPQNRKKNLNRHLVSGRVVLTSHVSEHNDTVPEKIDWREKGCVSEVKNQGRCGSCWAFSASGAVEGSYCLKYGKVPDLSEQQLIDCARKEGSRGCQGGDVDAAFIYMIREQGLCSENDYPYIGHSEHCRARKCDPKAQVVDFEDVTPDDEKALMRAIAFKGPISVGVQSDEWQLYHSGIFDKPCGKKLDHGVLIVGYGTLNNTDYWIIKNSWGPDWGESGYIKLARDSPKRYGECGILTDASYPVVG